MYHFIFNLFTKGLVTITDQTKSKKFLSLSEKLHEIIKLAPWPECFEKKRFVNYNIIKATDAVCITFNDPIKKIYTMKTSNCSKSFDENEKNLSCEHFNVLFNKDFEKLPADKSDKSDKSEKQEKPEKSDKTEKHANQDKNEKHDNLETKNHEIALKLFDKKEENIQKSLKQDEKHEGNIEKIESKEEKIKENNKSEVTDKIEIKKKEEKDEISDFSKHISEEDNISDKYVKIEKEIEGFSSEKDMYDPELIISKDNSRSEKLENNNTLQDAFIMNNFDSFTEQNSQLIRSEDIPILEKYGFFGFCIKYACFGILGLNTGEFLHKDEDNKFNFCNNAINPLTDSVIKSWYYFFS